jgi:hypothetical protein
VEIFAACPFAVSTLAWEPAPGRRSLCVCVKATFTLVPGAVSTLAPLQDPVVAEARDGDPAGALGELLPFKPRADILLTGHAHAPRGAPIDTMLARARVGTFRKALSINGDRTWVPSGNGLRPSVAVPFRRMALRYERAVRAGENLGGIDIIAQGAELGRPLPNLAAIADQGGETPGFGPLPLGWRARRHGLGDAALIWAARVALGAGPPPAGFDFRIFNAAPTEQQVDEIPAGVDIQLENLHPEHAWLETRLPALRVRLFRQPPRGERAVEVPVRCDTLAIDTDRGLASLCWRGAVLLEGSDEAAVGRLVVAVEAEGERIGPEHADRLLAQLAPAVTYVEAGPALGLPPVASAPRPGATSSFPPPRPPTTPPAVRPATVADETRGQGTMMPPAAAAASALPFRAPPTGFEGAPGLARESYPPPPVPAVLAVPPPVPAASPPVVRTPSWGPHPDEAGEATLPRGYPVFDGGVPGKLGALPPPRTPPPPSYPDRTASGTLLPPASVPPPRTAGGTLRPPPSSGRTMLVAIPPPAPLPPVPAPDEAAAVDRTATGTVRPPAPPPADEALGAAVERTATGTVRPPAPPSEPPRPTLTPVMQVAIPPAPPSVPPPRSVTPVMRAPSPPPPRPSPPSVPPPRPPPPSMPPPRSVTPVMMLAPPALPSEPPPRPSPPSVPPPRSVTPVMRAPSPPPRPVTPVVTVAPAEATLGLAAYCAIKVDAWRTAAPLAEVLGRHGVDEAAFEAYERAQAEVLAREAAEGRGDRAVLLYEALRAAREPPVTA